MDSLAQGYINHICLVLDASGSMSSKKSRLISVVDDQISYLAHRSMEADQETRVTIYSFDETVTCLVYDKDVLRLPSIADLYRIGGSTSLIDATSKAIDDLKKTATIYGDHAFLIYVLTDGYENTSRTKPDALRFTIESLPDNWTLAALVPDKTGEFEVKKYGFPSGSVAIWDAVGHDGINEAGRTIRNATENFMQARSSGLRGTRGLFTLDASSLSKTAVRNLQKLPPGSYNFLPVSSQNEIGPFVERALQRPYRRGEAFYQITKPEMIQPQKKIAIFDKHDLSVYTGSDARRLLGLPDYHVKVNPEENPNFTVFVQSTSSNRKLVPGTSLLVIHNA